MAQDGLPSEAFASGDVSPDHILGSHTTTSASNPSLWNLGRQEDDIVYLSSIFSHHRSLPSSSAQLMSQRSILLDEEGGGGLTNQDLQTALSNVESDHEASQSALAANEEVESPDAGGAMLGGGAPPGIQSSSWFRESWVKNTFFHLPSASPFAKINPLRERVQNRGGGDTANGGLPNLPESDLSTTGFEGSSTLDEVFEAAMKLAVSTGTLPSMSLEEGCQNSLNAGDILGDSSAHYSCRRSSLSGSSPPMHRASPSASSFAPMDMRGDESRNAGGETSGMSQSPSARGLQGMLGDSSNLLRHDDSFSPTRGLGSASKSRLARYVGLDCGDSMRTLLNDASRFGTSDENLLPPAQRIATFHLLPSTEEMFEERRTQAKLDAIFFRPAAERSNAMGTVEEEGVPKTLLPELPPVLNHLNAAEKDEDLSPLSQMPMTPTPVGSMALPFSFYNHMFPFIPSIGPAWAPVGTSGQREDSRLTGVSNATLENGGGVSSHLSATSSPVPDGSNLEGFSVSESLPPLHSPVPSSGSCRSSLHYYGPKACEANSEPPGSAGNLWSPPSPMPVHSDHEGSNKSGGGGQRSSALSTPGTALTRHTAAPSSGPEPPLSNWTDRGLDDSTTSDDARPPPPPTPEAFDLASVCLVDDEDRVSSDNSTVEDKMPMETGEGALPPFPDGAGGEKSLAGSEGRRTADGELAVEGTVGETKSAGSSLHPLSCKPCAFFWTKGCINGSDCQFCHEWHPPKKKKPMKDQKNLMIIARPDGKIEFLRCTIDEALRRS